MAISHSRKDGTAGRAPRLTDPHRQAHAYSSSAGVPRTLEAASTSPAGLGATAACNDPSPGDG